MTVSFRILLCLCSSPAVVASSADVRPFTIETVLQSLATSHPQASRVSDELPPGITAAENITFTAGPDQPLQLDLYRPEGAGKYPAVLIVHGGGWLAGDRSMERPFAKHLAAKGFVTAPVSYRLGRAGRFPAAVHDLKAAVRWLRAHASDHGVDPTRIAIIGGSAGGTLAAFVAASNGETEYEGDRGWSDFSSAVQGAVNIDGTATFADNALIRASEARRENPYLEFMHGHYRHSREVWIDASPLLHVGPQSAPTLFIKSTVRQPILVGREEMSERLRIFGIRSKVITYPESPHPFWLVHPWFEQVVKDSNEFLKECFSPAE